MSIKPGQAQLASPFRGRRERGKIPIIPVKNIIPGQTVTKEKLQRARPTALSGTSPCEAYDNVKPECGFNFFMVGFARRMLREGRLCVRKELGRSEE
jgi:hypothetical protein